MRDFHPSYRLRQVRSLVLVKARSFRACLFLFRKMIAPLRLGVGGLLVLGLLASTVAGVALPSPSYAATCTSAQKESTTYLLTVGGGTISRAVTGYQTATSTSRGQTVSSCQQITSPEVTQFTITSKGALTYTDGSGCSDIITLASNPTAAGQVSGSYQAKTVGTRGACENDGSASSISVTVKAASSGCSDTPTTTFTLVTPEQILGTQSSCAAGTVSATYSLEPNSSTVYTSQTDPTQTTGCGDNAMDGVVTLTSSYSTISSETSADRGASGGETQIGASFTSTAVGTRQQAGQCVQGTAQTVTVQISPTLVDTSALGVYSGVGSDYAANFCTPEASQDPSAYAGCLESYVGTFQGFMTSCDVSTTTVVQKDVTCLEKKAPSVTAELQALLTPPTPPPTTSCGIPQLGWILCPILTIGANLADDAYGFLANNFLETNPALVNSDPNATANGVKEGTATYTAWGVMRNIANVGFILAFLIMIFTQLTGQGVTNYGVKKMLPRLIVAAILVNASFYICQIAIDLSNILGVSLKGLFGTLGQQAIAANKTAGVTTQQGGSLFGIVTTVIATGTIVYLNLGAVITAMVAALIVLLVIFLILMIRLVLIVLLVVASPLAFVAYVFPGTESWFTRWRKLFTGLLLLFPALGLIYGACLLASAVLDQVARGETGSTATVMSIAAYFTLVVPLILVIPLLRGSLNGVAKLSGAIGSLSTRASKSAQGATQKAYNNSRVGQYRQYQGQRWQANRQLMQSGAYNGRGGKRNPLNWLSAANRGANKVSGRFGSQMAAAGISQVDEQEAKDVRAQQVLLQTQITSTTGTDKPVTAKQAMASAIRSGDRVKMKAAQNLLFTQGAGGMRDFYDVVAAADAAGVPERNMEALRENISTNHGQMVKTKAADISQWAAKGGQIATHTNNAATWDNMSAEDLAGQTAHSLERAARSNVVSVTTANNARDLLGDVRLNKSLNPEQVAALNSIGGGASRPPTPTEPTPPTTPPASSTPPTPPTNEGTPPPGNFTG